MKRSKKSVGIVALGALLLTGCALLLGKSYQPFQTVPGIRGVVYIYSAGTSSLQKVYIDRDPTNDGVTHSISMIKKGYYPYLVPPGLVRVLSGSREDASCVMIAIRENSHHWVRVTSSNPRVVEVDQETAEREIGGHREISRESLGDATGLFHAENCPMFGESEATDVPTPVVE